MKRNLQQIRPLWLLNSALLYSLGAGIADYLGEFDDWATFFVGLAWVLTLQMGFQFLEIYFRAAPPKSEDESQKLAYEAPLWFGLTALTLATTLTIVLQRGAALDNAVGLVMGLIFLGAVAYALPPLRLVDSAYRGLLISALLVNLIPALAFALQGAPLHRLVSMVTFPLTLLHYAMMLVFEFPAYAGDVKHQRRTILVRIGWQRGILLIGVLNLSAFLALGFAMLVGLPLQIAAPIFLVLPLALFLIWYFGRVAAGVKPNWQALFSAATLIYAFSVYLLAFAFWTR
ncbi:MAG: hypothetical protein ISR60_09425 [Anaerolineales bacterium]|nr:hypothetical protein [Anaerolineales bacterium]